MKVNFEIMSDLVSRGFKPCENAIMHYASGSICNYTDCKVYLNRKVYNEFADEFYYGVRYESFRESGEVSDHHTISECYIAESKLSEFLRGKYIYSDTEREAEMAKHRQRMRELRLRRQQS